MSLDAGAMIGSHWQERFVSSLSFPGKIQATQPKKDQTTGRSPPYPAACQVIPDAAERTVDRMDLAFVFQGRGPLPGPWMPYDGATTVRAASTVGQASGSPRPSLSNAKTLGQPSTARTCGPLFSAALKAPECFVDS